MTETIEKTEFRFEELSDKAKANARQHFLAAHRYPWDEWWDAIYADFVQVAERLGFVVSTNHINFSGFGSQGDGASFSGTYACNGPAVDAIKQHCNDETLLALAARLDAVQVGAQLLWGSTWLCKVAKGGHYCHSAGMFTTDIELRGLDGPTDDCAGAAFNEADAKIQAVARELADWLYKQLEAEYDYLTSDEAVNAQLIDQAGLYDEDGAII